MNYYQIPQMPQMPPMMGYPQMAPMGMMPPMGMMGMPPKKDDTMLYLMAAAVVGVLVYAYYSQQDQPAPTAKPTAENFVSNQWKSAEYDYPGVGVNEWNKIYGTKKVHSDDTTNAELILRGSELLGPAYQLAKVAEIF